MESTRIPECRDTSRKDNRFFPDGLTGLKDSGFLDIQELLCQAKIHTGKGDVNTLTEKNFSIPMELRLFPLLRAIQTSFHIHLLQNSC